MSVELGTWHQAILGRLAHKVVRIMSPYGTGGADCETLCGGYRILRGEVADETVERCKQCVKAEERAA